MKRIGTVVCIFLGAALVGMHVGCGGGGPSSEATGSLGLTVVFPSATDAPTPQLLPKATESVLVTIGPSGGLAGAVTMPGWQQRVLLQKPPGGGSVSGTVGNIPAGWVSVLAEAFPNQQGTGDVIAWAQTKVEVPAGGTATAHLVTEALTTAVELNVSEIALEPEQFDAFIATAKDADGGLVIGADFIWDSNDPAVATVAALSPLATVTAVGDGTCTVTATETITGKSAGCLVTVESRAVVTVEVIPPELTLYLFDVPSELLVSAMAFDESRAPIPYAEFAWDSDESAVATVDPGGLVQAVGQGLCLITATGSTAAGSAKGTCAVTVR